MIENLKFNMLKLLIGRMPIGFQVFCWWGPYYPQCRAALCMFGLGLGIQAGCKFMESLFTLKDCRWRDGVGEDMHHFSNKWCIF
jgi:hypothetical protein